MSDKPLDCIGLSLTAQVGKHDFHLHAATANTCAKPASLDKETLERAIAAMKALPPVEETIHHAKVGSAFWDRLKAVPSASSAAQRSRAAVFGFPVYVDDELPPDVCEFRNKDGKVLSTLRLEP